MANDKNSDITLFGQLHQLHGAVFYLSHAACRGIQFLIIQSLDGVHNEYIRPLLVHTLYHIAQISFGQYIEAFALRLQPLCPEL